MVFALKKLPSWILCAVFFGTTRTKCDINNSFQMIGKFPNLTAVYSTTSTYDGANLECLTAELTQYNSQEGTAAYTWYLKADSGDQETKVDYITVGDSPDELKVVSSTDLDTVWIAVSPFTDDETCYILKGRDMDNLCVLWVSTDYVDNIPKQCLQENEKICGQGVLLYDQKTCAGKSTQF